MTDSSGERLTEALIAEALFEARIGAPLDTPRLAAELRPPLLRLLNERATQSPEPSELVAARRRSAAGRSALSPSNDTEGLRARVEAMRLRGADYTTQYGHGYNDALNAVLAALASERTPKKGVCWFCKREVPYEQLIAGYDTFEEQRLACDECDTRMKAEPTRIPIPTFEEDLREHDPGCPYKAGGDCDCPT